MSSHRCMKIAQWSVAVLIKLFIRFPLESQRPWAAQNQTMFLYLYVWVGWSFAFFTVSKVSRGDVLEKKRSSCGSGGSGSTSGFWWSSVVDASGLLVGVEGWCFLPVWSDVCSSWAASEPGQTSLRAVPPPHVNNLLQCMLADTLMLAALPLSLLLLLNISFIAFMSPGTAAVALRHRFG